MIGFLVAAAVAGATPAAGPGAGPTALAVVPQAEPAVFVVRDADTTIYLFGTFHALDANAEWFHDQVRGAFESSDELVLETLIPEGPPKPG
ncbi:MAG: TraB/GumN family protein, partial [Sphingomicrobium sp.]